MPKNTNVIFPFYGDALDELLAALEATQADQVVAKGTVNEAADASFRGAVILELAENVRITEEQVRAKLGDKVAQKGPLNWSWVQATLRLLDETPLGPLSIDTFTRDVYVYLTKHAIRKKIDRLVADAIPKGPSVIVAHSLGTVVAYNVLSKMEPPCQVKLLVTLGSPLGVPTIQQNIEIPAKIPGIVQRWRNAYDERDVVALRALSPDTFWGTPQIENKSDVNNGTKNRHGIDGYLDDREIAYWIHEALS